MHLVSVGNNRGDMVHVVHMLFPLGVVDCRGCAKDVNTFKQGAVLAGDG